MRRTWSSEKLASKKRRKGPIAQLALLSLALPSSRADRPSTSRRFTSLPSVAPTIRPFEATASTTSGSGLFHDEAGCSPASAPVPTAAMAGALVKISASGPIPTSRYCDQAPCAISTDLRCMASGEPGFSLEKSSPTSRVISARMPAAAPRSPRARSSMTRSSIEIAKVTPAALMACRSIGASSQGDAGSRASSGVLRRMSSSEPIRSPLASSRASAGSGVSQRSRMVGNRAVMSKTPSGLMATTAGPPERSRPPDAGRQTRPASAPSVPSRGRVVVASRVRAVMACRCCLPIQASI